MKNKIIEQDGKAYIVEEVNDGKIKAKEYVFDTITNQFKKLKSATIEGEYQIIPFEMVKIKHAKEVKQEQKKSKK